MPVKASRRRATRRNDMSDIEDDATSRQPQDDVEESDEDPASRRVKREKGKRRAQQEVEEEPDADSDEAIDVENFPDQPLKREQMSKLLGLADDWGKLADIIKRPFEMFGMAAGGLADLNDEDAREVRMGLPSLSLWTYLRLGLHRK